MFPENENQQVTNGEDPSAVVVDLTESDTSKLIKPLTAEDEAGDKSGKQDESKGEHEDQADTTVNGSSTDDEEFRSTGRKDFDKRLKREMRAKIQERAEKAAIAEENERLRQENESLRATRAAPEVIDTSALDSKIGDVQKKLAKALEDGESDTAAALQVEIGTLTGQKAAKVAAPARREPPPAPRAAPKGGMTATGKAFVDANQAWWSDPDFAAARSAVVSLDSQLIKQGSDPNSEGHYQRIAKKAKELGLKVRIRQPFDDGDGDMGNDTTVDLDDRREQRRQAPPQGGNGNGRGRVNTEARDARAGKIVITEADKATMRTFKLDPENPQHMRAFAKSRQERILDEARS